MPRSWRMKYSPTSRARSGSCSSTSTSSAAKRNRGRQRIAAEGAAVIAGPQHVHDVAPREEGRHRQQAAAERFAQDETVRPHAIVLAREHAAGAPKTGLHFVADQQHVVARQIARQRAR